MPLSWPSKDPDELLDYAINWSAPLVTDTIVNSDWEINGSGLVEDHATYSSQTATIWLTGGTVNQTYNVTNTIETAAGRIFQQTVSIPITSK